MKKKLLWVLVILICGLATFMLTSCANEDLSAVSSDTENIDLTELLTIEAVEDGEVELYLDSGLHQLGYCARIARHNAERKLLL
jgi:hypothetical protein